MTPSTTANLTVVEGDITLQDCDVIVNAANTRMRGGGGVDGAIHAAAGPELLAECIAKFPNGLPTGEAGWTPGFDLGAKYIVHTPGPNFSAGQRDPQLLSSSYKQSLLLADTLGAKSVAFPLISAGIFGWPLQDAVDIAVQTLLETKTDLEQIRIVTPDPNIANAVRAAIEKWDR